MDVGEQVGLELDGVEKTDSGDESLEPEPVVALPPVKEVGLPRELSIGGELLLIGNSHGTVDVVGDNEARWCVFLPGRGWASDESNVRLHSPRVKCEYS